MPFSFQFKCSKSEDEQRLLDNIAARYGYRGTVKDGQGNDIPNPDPKTKLEYVEEAVMKFLEDTAADYEKEQAYTAVTAAEAKARTDMKLSVDSAADAATLDT